MLTMTYDTETTGLPKSWKAHVHEVDNWPRLVQLAWTVHRDRELLLSANHIIKCDVPSDPEAAATHGITFEVCQEKGIPISRALLEFRTAIMLVDRQVGHNINFDRKIIGAEFIRSSDEGIYEYMKTLDKYCTMFKSQKMFGKWPKLQELHTHLFGEEFDGAHDAMADVNATAACYFELTEIAYS